MFDLEWWRYLTSLAETRRAAPPAFAGAVDLDWGSDVFGTFLFRVSQLSRSAAATAATAALTFDHPDDVVGYLKAGSNPSDMADVLSSESGIHHDSGEIPLAAIYVGFGELVGFLDSVLRRSQRPVAAYGSRWPLTAPLLTKLQQLIRWRFVFIEQQSPLLYECIDRYVDALELEHKEARILFHAHVTSLAQAWRNVQGSQGNAAVSA